jgi:hypothetical protein
MNSVMDDNKLLTLPNRERIRLQQHVKLLFEVADLQYASPATISRWAACSQQTCTTHSLTGAGFKDRCQLASCSQWC